jgi:hypothetical protein
MKTKSTTYSASKATLHLMHQLDLVLSDSARFHAQERRIEVRENFIAQRLRHSVMARRIR